MLDYTILADLPTPLFINRLINILGRPWKKIQGDDLKDRDRYTAMLAKNKRGLHFQFHPEAGGILIHAVYEDAGKFIRDPDIKFPGSSDNGFTLPFSLAGTIDGAEFILEIFRHLNTLDAYAPLPSPPTYGYRWNIP